VEKMEEVLVEQVVIEILTLLNRQVVVEVVKQI